MIVRGNQLTLTRKAIRAIIAEVISAPDGAIFLASSAIPQPWSIDSPSFIENSKHYANVIDVYTPCILSGSLVAPIYCESTMRASSAESRPRRALAAS